MDVGMVMHGRDIRMGIVCGLDRGGVMWVRRDRVEGRGGWTEHGTLGVYTI